MNIIAPGAIVRFDDPRLFDQAKRAGLLASLTPALQERLRLAMVETDHCEQCDEFSPLPSWPVWGIESQISEYVIFAVIAEPKED